MTKLDLSLLEQRGYRRQARRGLDGVASELKLQRFPIPNVENVDDFQRATMERFKPEHGTTTLAFIYQEGIVVAVDSRATMGSYISSQIVKKAIEINDVLLGTMAGTAADCQFWGRYLGMKARLYELDHGKRITVRAASKLLADIAFQYRGSGLGMGMMVTGFDSSGPSLFYVDSEAQRTKGTMFSVGSGSLYAYGVMDAGYKWDLTKDEALELAKRSIYHATFRDTASGGTISVYHITKDGWTKVSGTDVVELYDKYTVDVPDVSFE